MRYPPLLVLMAALCSIPVARADDALPTSSGWYLIHRFSFDERDQGNYEDMPRFWYVTGRRPDTTDPNFLRYPLHEQLVHAGGFGAYSAVHFDAAEHVSGRESFYLGVDGGSAGAFLEVGAVPATPQTDYCISALVKTQDLHRASVRLLAYLVDSQGARIDSSIRETTLPPLPKGASRPWQPILVRLVGESPAAAWIGLELQVLQPQEDRQHPERIVYQDVRGGAWFDDVCIWQIPRLLVQTQSPVNILRGPDSPNLTVQTRHQQTRPLTATLRLFDDNLDLVASSSRVLNDRTAAVWHWQPPLARYGWYVAELTLGQAREGADRLNVDRTLCPFLWLPRVPDDVSGLSQFQIDVTDTSPQSLEQVPALMQALQIRAVSVSCWRSDPDDPPSQQQARLDSLLERLGDRSVETELVLSPLPAALARQSQLDPAFFLLAPKETWAPYLTPLVMRHGQDIKRWRLASPAIPQQLPDRLRSIQQVMQELVPGPRLVLPLPAYLGATNLLGQTSFDFAVRLPAAVVPSNVPQYLEEWQGQEKRLNLSLDLPSPHALSPHRRVEDLVLRMLYAAQCQPARISVDAPWSVLGIGSQSQLVPDPLAGVFAMTAQRLAGRRFLGWLPLRPGLRGMIFDGERGGVLAAWNEAAATQDATLRLYLGESPAAVDVWGNRCELPATPEGHELTLGSTPVFIEGIDVPLALFRASFRVEPQLVLSMQSPQDKELILHNPWNRTISGKLVILRPQEWGYQPNYHEFSIPAGQTARLPVRMSFPTSEIAGDKQLVVKMQFTADRTYNLMANAPLVVGLPDLDFQAHLVLEPQQSGDGPADVLVTEMVTNRSDRALSLYAYASLPQQALQEKSIQQLLPGQSVVRTFRFEGAAEIARQHPVRVGVRETSGPNGINRLLPLH